MTVAVLSLGTELTRGELENKNATWLSNQLTLRGLHVGEILTTDDNDSHILAAIKRLAREHDAIVCTGGLGPTTDDRTTACVAQLLAVPLECDQETLERLHTLFAKHGVEMTASNRKQALFPQGATILPNSQGTAPGFHVQIGSCRAFFLPGVPSEMRRMFDLSVAPNLPAADLPTFCLRLRTYNMPESSLGERLSGLEEEHNVVIGYRASLGCVEVKVLSTSGVGEMPRMAEERGEAAFSEAVRRLGDAVYSIEDESLELHVGNLLSARGLTLGLAESCTGGLVSQKLTRHAGASAYFLGGVCAYANAVKTGVLGVLPDTLQTHGAVSEEVAKEMAIGARRLLGVDYALSLTGIAGPGGGTDEKPVGLVHWAVAGPTGVQCEQRVFSRERPQVQERAALAGLWSVRQMVLGQ